VVAESAGSGAWVAAPGGSRLACQQALVAAGPWGGLVRTNGEARGPVARATEAGETSG